MDDIPLQWFQLGWSSDKSHGFIELLVFVLTAWTFKGAYKDDLVRGAGRFPSVWFLAGVVFFMLGLEVMFSHGWQRVLAPETAKYYCESAEGPSGGLQIRACPPALVTKLTDLMANERRPDRPDPARPEVKPRDATQPTAREYAGTQKMLIRNAPYAYGAAFVRVLDVPLWVPLGWAVIFHISMVTARRVFFRPIAQALLTGLLALDLDFALDPIAHFAGWWVWGERGASKFFGVPISNYMAWFLLVAGICFLAFYWRHLGSGMSRLPIEDRPVRFVQWVRQSNQWITNRGPGRTSRPWVVAILGVVPLVPPVRAIRARLRIEGKGRSWLFKVWIVIRAFVWALLFTALMAAPFLVMLFIVIPVTVVIYHFDTAAMVTESAKGGGASPVYIGSFAALTFAIGWVVWLEFPGKRFYPLDFSLLRIPITLFTCFLVLFLTEGLYSGAETLPLAVVMPTIAAFGIGVFLWPYFDLLFKERLRDWAPRELRRWTNEQVNRVLSRPSPPEPRQ